LNKAHFFIEDNKIVFFKENDLEIEELNKLMNFFINDLIKKHIKFTLKDYLDKKFKNVRE
jgi:hypothetical protein